MKFSRRMLYSLFLSGLIVSFGSLAASGQASRNLINVERRIDTMNRQAKDFERDNMGREATAKNDPETAKRSRQIRVEIEEDLNSLQFAYNTTIAAMKNASELRPGFAGETARGVRKSALRLKSNLALPAPDEKEENQAATVIMDTERKALTALCRKIYEFVTNPIFEATGGLDAKNGAKARNDLDTIIRLADHLSGHAESTK